MRSLDFIGSGVHICVVAKEIVPNLAPILDKRFNTKLVILVHTDDFEKSAKNLQASYQDYQIKTEFFQIQSAFKIDSLRKEFTKLFNKYAEQKPLVNITVGTKIISLILFEKAKQYNLSTYYLNPDDSISWLIPEKDKRYQLQDRIKIKPFLKAKGFEVKQTTIPNNQAPVREALDNLIQDINKYQKSIPQLNYYAYTAGKTLKSACLEGDVTELKKLVGLFASTEIMKISNNKLVFKDENARFFANGGWLEEYIYHQIKQLSSQVSQIQDNLCGVEVRKTSNGVKNEIDNMLLCNNNLHLIECKTKRFSKDQKPDGGASTAIYKLDTLMQELGGGFAKGMLVSIFNLSNSDYDRAKQYNVKIISLLELKKIKIHLKNWLTL